MKTELLALKAKVCGFEHTSRVLRKRITKNVGVRRGALRLRKRHLGEYTREHLIAYGLLRNIPYKQIEGKCAPNNLPNVQRVLDIILAHVQWNEKAKWNRVLVEKLLTGVVV
jgi:hypothetical protein